MKILLLADLSSPHSWRWLESLRERGTEVRAISFEKPLKESGDVIYIETFVRNKRWKYLLNSRKVKKLIKDFSPDLLNPHFISNYGLLARIAGGGIPYFLCVWGSDLLLTPKKGIFQRFWTGRILKGAQAVYVDSEMLKEIVISYGVHEAKIFLFPFGIKEPWHKIVLEDYKPGPPWILFSHRRLDPDMDPMTLLLGFKSILDKGYEANFTLASRGTLEEDLKKEANRLKIDGVRFAGWQKEEDLREFLKRSHFYLSASLTDSTSVSLLEAMASGAFPIVSDIPGNREWIRDGENGLLFTPKNPEDLCEKIIVAMNNKELVEKGRLINKEIVTKRADWDRNFNQAFQKMGEISRKRKSIYPGDPKI